MTKIEWTDATWNPVTGCTKVSAGCKNCYADGVADRFWAKQYPPTVVDVDGAKIERPRRFADVRTHEDRLDGPLRWRKPRRVFVNSMSDLFHDAVPDEFIDRVFAVMALASQHTFQVLTKRPERMLAYLRDRKTQERVSRASVFFVPNSMLASKGIEPDLQQEAMAGWAEWPLPNVWLGVSVEDQRAADERIPLLLETPAAVRFLSCEPLLGPINLEHVVDGNTWSDRHGEWDSRLWDCQGCGGTGWLEPSGPATRPHDCRQNGHAGVGIDWVIVGGESGPGARPCDVAWIRSIVEQCKAAQVPAFVKQLGRVPVDSGGGSIAERFQIQVNGKGGDPSEWPDDVRVRQFPRGGAR